VTGVGLALLVAVGAASLTTWGFESIRETRYLGRFSNLFESTGRVRLLIWDATTRLMMSDPLRSVIGYGPETLRLVSAPHISPALGQVEQRGALPDRAHNETLDAWVTTGLPGLLLYLTLFAMLFLRGLESAGIVRSPRDRRVFLSSMLIGAAAGASSAPWIDGSWRSAAPLLALGMVCGLCGYLVARSVSGWRGTGDPIPAGGDSGLLALAMLSALAGHFVEIQFGIAVTSTRLYFWTFAALLIVAPLWADREPTPGSEETALDEGSAALPWRELLGSSVIVTFTLVTLTYDFFPSRGPSSTPGSIVWLLAFAWVLGGVVVVAEAGARVADRMSRSMALKSAAVYGASTLVPAVLFAALHAIWTRSVTDLADVPRLFHPWLLLLILTAGAVFHSRRPPAPATRWALWAVPGVAAVMLFFAVETSARPVRADIFYKEALLLSMQRDGADQARGRIRRAIALEPENSVYHALHAEILLENALRSDDLRESESLLEQGEQSIRMARHLSPLDPDYPADRARLNLRWSARVPDAARRSSRLERTVDLYREALAVSPSNVLLWNELGVTRLLKGDLEAALETFNHSLRLDDAFAETHLHLANVYRRQGDAEHAARALEAATALMPPERRAAIEDLAEALLRLESIEPASR
jgi:hypothetical protein